MAEVAVLQDSIHYLAACWSTAVAGVEEVEVGAVEILMAGKRSSYLSLSAVVVAAEAMDHGSSTDAAVEEVFHQDRVELHGERCS